MPILKMNHTLFDIAPYTVDATTPPDYSLDIDQLAAILELAAVEWEAVTTATSNLERSAAIRAHVGRIRQYLGCVEYQVNKALKQ